MKTALRKFGAIIVITGLLSACAIFNTPPQMPPRSEIVPGETITVRGNESVYGVAQDHHVSMRDIIVLNNLQPPFTLRPGQSLILPANGAASESYSSFAPSSSAPPPAAAPSGNIEAQQLAPIESSPLPPPATTSPVESLNAPTPPPKPVATTASPPPEQTATVAAPPAPEEKPSAPPPSVSMIWPVKGPILSSFGPKGQGLDNEGINIGAPRGAPVVAAGNGIVAYAGNEMKGFGNLILIRHEGGWVTAYAHLDRVLVSKDAVVDQGDEIGTVGKTGSVPSPQLHFEIRYRGKPVDPSSVITP